MELRRTQRGRALEVGLLPFSQCRPFCRLRTTSSLLRVWALQTVAGRVVGGVRVMGMAGSGRTVASKSGGKQKRL